MRTPGNKGNTNNQRDNKSRHPIHDAAFKLLVEHVDVIVSLIKAAGEQSCNKKAAPLLNMLDLNTVKIIKSNFISKSMKEFRCDVVISVKLFGFDEWFKIVLIFEHKSYKDSKVYIQSLGYLYGFISSSEHDGKSVPIPFIVTNARSKSKFPNSFREAEFAMLAKYFIKHTPNKIK